MEIDRIPSAAAALVRALDVDGHNIEENSIVLYWALEPRVRESGCLLRIVNDVCVGQ